MVHLTFIHNLEYFKASYIPDYQLLYIFWEMLAHLLFIHNILNEPLVSIGQVGCSRVPAWRPFQWLLYMSRVSQKKFGDPRSMRRTQR